MRALTFIFSLINNDDTPATVSDLAFRGVVGLTGVAGGVGLSLAVTIQWLQVVSLCVGIAVGIITFVSIARSLHRNGKAQK